MLWNIFPDLKTLDYIQITDPLPKISLHILMKWII